MMSPCSFDFLVILITMIVDLHYVASAWFLDGSTSTCFKLLSLKIHYFYLILTSYVCT